MRPAPAGPETEIEGWWTSLCLDEETPIARYADQRTCKQYHSEFRTYLDIKRMPLGPLATNPLVPACAVPPYNTFAGLGKTV